MAEVGDRHQLRYRRKAIDALLPYAVQRERDGKPEMFNAYLCAIRASGKRNYPWRHIASHADRLLCEASPRAIVLASPHVPWYYLTGDSVQRWATAVSGIPYTEEVGQSVVDALLHIASESKLLPHIPVGVWSWLTKRPSLPPFCPGRYIGTQVCVVQAVRALKDVEILKFYLLLVWSERESIWSDGFDEMCTSIREDLGGIGIGHHRADLIQHLDHVLGQLDRGSGYRQQQYEKLEKLLLEAERRASSPMIMLFSELTLAKTRRISRNVYVCSSFPVSVVLWSQDSVVIVNSLLHLRILLTIICQVRSSHPSSYPPAALRVVPVDSIT
jgi:hypothetical protein